MSYLIGKKVVSWTLINLPQIGKKSVSWTLINFPQIGKKVVPVVLRVVALVSSALALVASIEKRDQYEAKIQPI